MTSLLFDPIPAWLFFAALAYMLWISLSAESIAKKAKRIAKDIDRTVDRLADEVDGYLDSEDEDVPGLSERMEDAERKIDELNDAYRNPPTKYIDAEIQKGLLVYQKQLVCALNNGTGDAFEEIRGKFAAIDQAQERMDGHCRRLDAIEAFHKRLVESLVDPIGAAERAGVLGSGVDPEAETETDIAFTHPVRSEDIPASWAEMRPVLIEAGLQSLVRAYETLGGDLVPLSRADLERLDTVMVGNNWGVAKLPDAKNGNTISFLGREVGVIDFKEPPVLPEPEFEPEACSTGELDYHIVRLRGLRAGQQIPTLRSSVKAFRLAARLPQGTGAIFVPGDLPEPQYLNADGTPMEELPRFERCELCRSELAGGIHGEFCPNRPTAKPRRTVQIDAAGREWPPGSAGKDAREKANRLKPETIGDELGREVRQRVDAAARGGPVPTAYGDY